MKKLLSFEKAICFIVCMSISISQLKSQETTHITRAFKIGDTVNSVTFKNLINYPKSSITIEELKGKLVIIDFWSTGCASCIASFPYLERLQAEYDGKLQYVLINPWETKEQINRRVKHLGRLRPGIGLTTLPVIYGDTLWRSLFPHSVLPHQVWIDQNGILIASTRVNSSTKGNIEKVLRKIPVKFDIKDDKYLNDLAIMAKGVIRPADSSILINGYSSFFAYSPLFGSYNNTIVDSSANKVIRQAYNIPIVDLYKIAFQIPPFEKERIVIKAKDSERYDKPKDMDLKNEWKSKYTFSYELQLPISQKDSINKYMQYDLNRFFRAFNIQGYIQKQNFPAYILKRYSGQLTPVSSVIDKNRNQILETQNGYRFVNYAFGILSKLLRSKLEHLNLSKAFVDESGISDEYLITVELPKKDEDLISLLKKQGFEIQEDDRKIDILVIKDNN